MRSQNKMTRVLLLVVALVVVAGTALAEPPAQPCPSINAGWTIPFSGPITSVGYDQTAQMLDVAFGSVMTTFANVPLGVMQGFQNTTNPLALYNSLVVPSYHALFLFQQNNCPLQLESGGYLWTD
jgi:hypothetical protein